jgi:hypothetical protein
MDILLRFFRIFITHRHVVVDQILTEQSSAKVATYDPTGSHAMPFTKLECIERTATVCPSTMSQTTASVSRLQEAKYVLSGDHARSVTPRRCLLQYASWSLVHAFGGSVRTACQHAREPLEQKRQGVPKSTHDFPVFNIRAVVAGSERAATLTWRPLVQQHALIFTRTCEITCVWRESDTIDIAFIMIGQRSKFLGDFFVKFGAMVQYWTKRPYSNFAVASRCSTTLAIGRDVARVYSFSCKLHTHSLWGLCSQLGLRALPTDLTERQRQ